MRIVNAAEHAWEPYAKQRKGTITFRQVLRGQTGRPDNYEWAINDFGTDGNYSPRHHHNFEQFRLARVDAQNYAPGKDILPGQLAYFPEGAYYGPQNIVPQSEMLILQFGGPSGSGYMDFDQTRRGSEELMERGTFENGIYKGTKADGNAYNQDGYEAVWEHVNGKKIQYIKPRYKEPILIDPDAFEWVPIQGADGAAQRVLGVFNERGTAARQYQVARDGQLSLTADNRLRLFIVLSGAVVIDGAEGGPETAFELGYGESTTVLGAGDEPAILLNLDLPSF